MGESWCYPHTRALRAHRAGFQTIAPLRGYDSHLIAESGCELQGFGLPKSGRSDCVLRGYESLG